jgi:hypothetical protein
MSDSVVSGPEYAVIVSPDEVPVDVLEPAERAAKIVRGKATKSIRVRYARPELVEEAIDRVRYEREHEELFEEQAKELGLTVPEIAFHQLARIPEAEGARVDLAGARSLFFASNPGTPLLCRHAIKTSPWRLTTCLKNHL